jgi:hypothetical protein
LSQVHDIFPLGRTDGARSGRIPIPRRD